MRISCIIPTRDRCQMVLGAISSAVEQHHDAVEIVVVDDGSTDTTEAEVKRCFPQVHLIKTSGLGPGPARNAGVAASTGDILMFLDSDDLWFPHHVNTLAAPLKNDFEVSYGVCRTIDEVNGGEFLIPENGLGTDGDCFTPLLRWCFLVPSATAVSRRAFDAVGGFGSEAFEDWAFFLRLSSRFPFGFADGPPVTLRRLHPGSLCHRPGSDKIITGINQLTAALAAEPRTGPEELARFKKLALWVALNGEYWESVQEWYLQMKKEGII